MQAERALAPLALAIMGQAIPVPAKADQAFEVAQLVCAPANQYFSANRRYISDLDPRQETRSEFAAVVLTDSLESKPFHCNWNGHRIVVRALEHSNSTGCPAEDGDVVDISLDEKHIACLEGAETKFDDHQSMVLLNADGIASSNGDILMEHCSGDLHAVDRDKHILADAGSLRCVTSIFHGTT